MHIQLYISSRPTRLLGVLYCASSLNQHVATFGNIIRNPSQPDFDLTP